MLYCRAARWTFKTKPISIAYYAFKDCIRLKRVVCGKGVKKIAAWAFGGCENLTDLVHGPDVEISPQAFAHNRNILEIKY